MGMASSICDTISGGVIIAASIKIIITTYLNFVIKKLTFSTPIFIKKRSTTGNWKQIPKPTKNWKKKEIKFL